MKSAYIHRELSNIIKEAARYFSVITITGPRQSGKTTLIRNEFGQLPYYSLEKDTTSARRAISTFTEIPIRMKLTLY